VSSIFGNEPHRNRDKEKKFQNEGNVKQNPLNIALHKKYVKKQTEIV
jgi:hypothetical protein